MTDWKQIFALDTAEWRQNRDTWAFCICLANTSQVFNPTGLHCVFASVRLTNDGRWAWFRRKNSFLPLTERAQPIQGVCADFEQANRLAIADLDLGEQPCASRTA